MSVPVAMLQIVLKTLILYFVTNVETARILVDIPTPSISHQVVFRPLTQELARRGHEVVVITTDPAFPKGQTPANLTEIDVHDVTYKVIREHVRKYDGDWKSDPVYHMTLAMNMFSRVFEVQLSSDEVKNVLKEKFDLVMVEACSRPAFVLSHVFKAPMILISSVGGTTGAYDIVGAPTHAFLYPAPIRLRSYNLTFFEKVQALYFHFRLTWNYFALDKSIDDMLRKHFGEDVPSMDELRNNVGMLYQNMHPILEGNHPMPPSVVNVWGIHQNPQKELPKELKYFLDNSKAGVIYISFGTNVNIFKLPKDKMQIFADVLSQLPYDVLWKWNKDAYHLKMAPNIKTEKWFPQSDLLRHPKVKLFITQGGSQSADEAIAAGVPLIGVPIQADQFHNTEKYVRHNIGLKLDLDTLSKELLENAINEVIRNLTYRQNIQELDKLLRDQPQTPLERAVWWTEHVLRHSGAAHLRAPAANISWAEYFELEFVAQLLSCVLVLLLLCSALLYCLWKCVRTRLLRTKRKID